VVFEAKNPRIAAVLSIAGDMNPRSTEAEKWQARFLEKAARLANIALGAGALASLFALLYFYYHYGWIADRKFDRLLGVVLYYVIPAVVSIVLLGTLGLKARYKINLAVVFLAVTATLLGTELCMELLNIASSEPQLPVWQVNGQSQEKKQRIKQIAKQYGIDFDIRDEIEVLAEFRKRGVDAVPMVTKFLDLSNPLWIRNADGSIQSTIKIAGKETIPLGAVANKLTILCNESGSWVTYLSDDHGFNNPKGLWQSSAVDIVAVGDSFTQGYCVSREKSFVGLVRERFPVTLDLGMAGEGPLIELASLEEYLPSLRPKHVLWFYFEGNDLTDLQTEKKIPSLMRYLKGDFSQGLVVRQEDIDHALLLFIEEQIRRKLNESQPLPANWISRRANDLVGIIGLRRLRNTLGLVQGRDTEEAEARSDYELSSVDVFRDVMAEAKRLVIAHGATLQFVYLPTSSRYFDSPEAGVKMRDQILKVVTGLGIPVIDIHPAFQAHNDVRSLFPWRGHGHYNEDGHRIVAGEVLKAIAPPQGSVSPPFSVQPNTSGRSEGRANVPR